MFGKDILGRLRVGLIANNAIMTSAAKTGTEADLVTSKWATAFVMLDKGTTGITYLSFFTYTATGTAYSSAYNITGITQNNYNTTSALRTLTIASGIIAAMSYDGVACFTLPNVNRFVNAYWTGTETDTVVSILILGHEMGDAPYGNPVTVQSAY
jgi:hypothetical protein